MNLMLAGLIGFCLGALVMFFIMYHSQNSNKNTDAEEKLNDYKDSVEKHFSQTADLIDNLTDSYKQVFEHLSESAEELLTDEQIQRQLMNRKSREVTLSYLAQKEESDDKDKNKPINPNPWAG